MNQYRSIFVSDVHLGSGGAKVQTEHDGAGMLTAAAALSAAARTE